MKGKRKFGFRNEDDDRIICRRILLNTLIRGPVLLERVVASAARDYGFCRDDLFGAARWWNVVEEECDGQRWWRKPDVLAVLPKWNYSRKADRTAVAVA